jgi:hypothetical protein
LAFLLKKGVNIVKSIICYGFLMVLVGYLLFPSLTHAAIPATERQALIALYNSTHGDSMWLVNSGWKEPPLHRDGFAMPGTENTWYGITCDAGNTSVQNLNLDFNQYTGRFSIPSEGIPPELGNLVNLQYLSLNGDELTGSIPPELGNLANLQYLSLNGNQLTGSIPPELINMTNL